MAWRGVTQARIVEKPAAIGIDENERNLRNMVSRGKFTRGGLTAMFSRARLAFNAFGVGVAAFIICAAAPLPNHRGQSTGGEPSAKTQQTHTPQRRHRSGFPAPVTIKPPPANPQPERDEWREEQDLKAQEEMAKWAIAMFFATAFGVAVTTVGVVYVRRTLDATLAAVEQTRIAAEAASDSNIAANAMAQAAKEANDITREAFITEARPWLIITVSAIDLEITEDMIKATIKSVIKNTGKMPAKRVTTWLEPTSRGDAAIAKVASAVWAEQLQLAVRERAGPSQIIAPTEEAERIYQVSCPIEFRRNRNESERVVLPGIIVSAVYTFDEPEAGYHQSGRTWAIRDKFWDLLDDAPHKYSAGHLALWPGPGIAD